MTTVTQLADLVQGRLAAARTGDVERRPDPVEAALAAQHFDGFELEYDRGKKILFCYFNYAGRPCFTPALLREAQAIQRMVRGLFGDGIVGEPPLRYLVLASHTPTIWNLGGDLELFSTLIRNRDRAGLRRYAHTCCEIAFTNATGLGFDLPIISVALVQGDALGGGFEAVLSSNLIVAERSAKFGLPEILFNLFPGMGAYTFLARRIAPGIAERLIMSGEIYTAEQLHALGVVDVLAADGQGRQAFYDFIGRRERRYAAQRALYRARRLVNPVTFEEMTCIADLWVEAAFKLEDVDLKRMERLVTAQQRRGTGA
jgi:DSF synthase